MYHYHAIYTNFNDKQVEEDLYFNLTEAEVVDLQFGTIGGYGELLKEVVKTDDRPALIKIFKEFLLKTYGEKSPDGKYHFKSDEISAKFACSAVYSKIYMKMATDAKFAAEFMNGVLPADMRKNYQIDGQKILAEAGLAET